MMSPFLIVPAKAKAKAGLSKDAFTLAVGRHKNAGDNGNGQGTLHCSLSRLGRCSKKFVPFPPIWSLVIEFNNV
jgi:hypothetical protein